jgi:hypothetical protein
MKSVEINLDGTKKVGFLKNSDIRAIERGEGGLSILTLISKERLGLDLCGKILYQALKNTEPLIKPQQVEKLVDNYLDTIGDFAGLIGMVADCVKASGVLGKDDETPKEKEGA